MQTITHNLKNRHTLKYAFFSLVLLLAGCRGEEGPIGPEGNANVQTAIYDVPPQHWSANSDGGFTAILTVPEITSDIYNNGAVLVYMLNESDPSNKSFNMLPYTYVDTTSITYMDYDVYVGEIDIHLKWVDNGIDDTQVPGTTESFKVVIIEGTPLSTLKTQVNIADYRAVSNYLKLKESAVIVK